MIRKIGLTWKTILIGEEARLNRETSVIRL